MVTISLCMIVRDEEQRLDDFFDSLGDDVDQVVVVDTGSVDRTREILTQRGVEVVDFEWCDDFAAARNVGLERATGDWILVMDADERLDDDALLLLRERAEIADEDVLGYVIDVRNYTSRVGGMEWLPLTPEEQEKWGAVAYYPTQVVRFFRNDPRVRYRGRVHELVEPAIEAVGGRHVSAEITLHHWLNGVEVKGHRYLELQKLKADDEPDSAKAQWELGLQHLRVGELEPGIEALEKAWKLAPGNVEIGIHLAISLNDAGRPVDAIEVLGKVRDADEPDPRVEFQLGQAFLVLGRHEDARSAFESAHQRAPHLPHPIYWRARLMLEQDLDGARALVEELVADQPEYWQGWLLRAELQVRDGLTAEAAEDAVMGVRKGLMSRESLTELAGFLRRIPVEQHGFRCTLFARMAADDLADEFAKALRSFRDSEVTGAFAAQVAHRRTMSGEPIDDETRFDLAEYHLLRGELQDGAELLAALAQGSPLAVRAGYRLARLFIDGGEVQSGGSLLEQVLALEPEHVPALIDLAGLHGNSGRLGNASEYLERALHLQPDNSTIHHNLAVLAALSDPPQIESATEHWSRAKELGHPINPELEQRLATCAAGE